MTLFEQIQKYAGIVNEDADDITKRAQAEKDKRKQKAKKEYKPEDFKNVVEKMKGWDASKINNWIEAHREKNFKLEDGAVRPWSDEKLENLKKAFEEYGLDLSGGKVDSRNFSPYNNRKAGSDAWKYQDKLNNKSAAKLSIMNVISSLGWKDGNSALSLEGIPTKMHTEQEIKTVINKEIAKLDAIVKSATDKNNEDIKLCKRVLRELIDIKEEEIFDKTLEDVKGYKEWEEALKAYKENKNAKTKAELVKYSTKNVKPNIEIFNDLWSIYTSNFQSNKRELVGLKNGTDLKDLGKERPVEVLRPKWNAAPPSEGRAKDLEFVKDVIPPDGRSLAADLGPDSKKGIQTNKEELVKTFKEITAFLRKNKEDLDRLRDPNYKEDGYEETESEENDELMNRFDRLLKTTYNDYKKLLRDINVYYSHPSNKIKGAKPAEFGEGWYSPEEIRGALSAAYKAYENATETGKENIKKDIENLKLAAEQARRATVTDNLRAQKESGELKARRDTRAEAFKANEVIKVGAKQIEPTFGKMQKYYYLALVKGHNESKVYLGDDDKIYILNKRNGMVLQQTYPNKMVDKHNDKDFKEKYAKVLEAIKQNAAVETEEDTVNEERKYFNY